MLLYSAYICTYTWYIITVLRFYEKYSISIKQATWKKERMGKYIYVSLNGMEKGDERDENKLVRRGGCLMTHLIIILWLHVRCIKKGIFILVSRLARNESNTFQLMEMGFEIATETYETKNTCSLRIKRLHRFLKLQWYLRQYGVMISV